MDNLSNKLKDLKLPAGYDSQQLPLLWGDTPPPQPPGFSREQIHAAVRIAMRPCMPRYLFRAWSNKMPTDCNAVVSTTEKITPSAFRSTTAGLSGVLDMDFTLLYHMLQHWDWECLRHTVFSLWTQSFTEALSNASTSEDPYISVIDTTQLDDNNCILYCVDPGLEGMDIPGSSTEFLVFGVVQGACHKAVPLSRLRDYVATSAGAGYQYRIMKDKSGRYRDDASKINSEEVTAAEAFGEQFGPQFKLPMAVSFLSIAYDISGHSELHNFLLGFEIPVTWTADTTFSIQDEYMGGGWLDDHAMACKTMKVLLEKLIETGRIATAESSGNDELKQIMVSDVDQERSQEPR